MLGTLVYIYSSKTRVRKVSKLAVFFVLTEASDEELKLKKRPPKDPRASFLVSCEGEMCDEASSNVELDLDSADEVAFDSEYVHYCFSD